MKKSIFLLCTGLVLILLFACKKDKKDPPDNGSGEYTPTEVQVILPAGSSVDLSTTTIFALSKTSQVDADGKSVIPFNTGTYELAYLFDASDNLLMMGFISDVNKEISVTSTVQALLYFGLDIPLVTSEEARISSIKRISTYSQWGDFRLALEKAFVTDPLMLTKGQHLEALVKTVNEISNIPVIDAQAKQVKVEDADETKSGLTVKAKDNDEENIEIKNDYFRRGHAFLYKTGYKDNNNTAFTLISSIDGSTTATKDLPVKGRPRLKDPEISGPVPLPLESHEKEATWKVRVIGVGGNLLKLGSPALTSQESAKLEEMWVDFFAADLLLPFMLDALNQRSSFWNQVHPNNLEIIQPFIGKAKEFGGEFGTIEQVKTGGYRTGVSDFLKQIAEKPYKWEDLATTLIACVNGKTGKYVQYEADVKAEFAKTKAILQILAEATDPKSAALAGKGNLTYIHDMYSDEHVTIHDNCNTLEEWTVKSKDNDVRMTPRNSQTMTFTNHTLTVSANPDLSAGETIEYKWTTAGLYGVFKNGTQESTTITSASKTIIYYGQNTPNEDNIEKVYVTAYIKSGSSAREIGSDTGTINVKKLKIEMKPQGATLSPRNGSSAMKLRLLNADGSDPILNGSAVQYKVEWSTPGSYGHFSGNVTQLTTTVNNITYIATDEDIKSATETISARIYFKLASTGWIFREEVKGSVKISNELKKIVYYTSPTAFHTDDGNCAVGCGVVVKRVTDAVSYSVKVTGIQSKLYPTYSDAWTVTGNEDHVRGYMGYVLNEADAGEDYITGVYGTFSWTGGPTTDHFNIPNCTGTAEVTVMVKE